MAGVGRVKAFGSSEIRLVIGGGWSAEAAQELAAGGYDIVELHSGNYDDFGFLLPFREKISSLSILGGVWKSSAGLDSLQELKSLTIGPRMGKGFDFSVLSRLEKLNIDGWLSSYAGPLSRCEHLLSLRIEGYDKEDCEDLGNLSELRRLTLAKGKLKTLRGLSSCGKLEAIELAHLRTLADISEVANISSLRSLELSDALPALRDLRSIFGKTELRRLSLRGLNVKFDDVGWLNKFTKLHVLGIWNVTVMDWDALLASKDLKKMAVTFSRPPGLSLDQVRDIAVAHGLLPTEVKALGVPAKPKGYMLEFRPKGSTQNLWYWDESQP